MARADVWLSREQLQTRHGLLGAVECHLSAQLPNDATKEMLLENAIREAALISIRRARKPIFRALNASWEGGGAPAPAEALEVFKIFNRIGPRVVRELMARGYSPWKALNRAP